MSIGMELQRARQEQHLTQQDVANKLYVTRQTISRWEQEKTMPNVYALKDLADLYGVSINALVSQPLHNSDEEEGNNMRKINWMALFGFFWFNLIFTLGAGLAVAGILAGAWLTIVAFIGAPLLLVVEWLVVIIMHLPWPDSLSWYQAIFAVILCALGVGALPLAKNLTVTIGRFCKQYVRYNLKSIYIEK